MTSLSLPHVMLTFLCLSWCYFVRGHVLIFILIHHFLRVSGSDSNHCCSPSPSLTPKELLSTDTVAYFSATKYSVQSLSCNDINFMFISSDPCFYFKTFFFHTFIKSKQYPIVMLDCVPGPAVNHREQRFDYSHAGPGPKVRKVRCLRMPTLRHVYSGLSKC